MDDEDIVESFTDSKGLILPLVTLVLAVLKIFGVIGLPWWVVLAPAVVYLLAVFILLTFIIVAMDSFMSASEDEE